MGHGARVFFVLVFFGCFFEMFLLSLDDKSQSKVGKVFISIRLFYGVFGSWDGFTVYNIDGEGFSSNSAVCF